MKNLVLTLILLVSYASFTSSCVSRRDFDRLTLRKAEADNARREADEKAANASKDNEKLVKTNGLLSEENQKLKIDSATAGSLYRKNKILLDDVFAKYDRLERSYNQLLSNSAAEQGLLSKSLTRKEQELADAQALLNKQKAEFEKYSTSQKAMLTEKQVAVEQLEKDIEAKKAKLTEMEKRIAEKDSAVARIRKSVAGALLNYKSSDLTVEMKNGVLHVSLAEALLFKTGSYVLQNEGVTAIQKLAEAIRQNKDIQVQIEGHTDDVEYKKPVGAITDNWDLSVLRATSLARVLKAEGVPGENITATGRAQYMPLIKGTSPEIRSKNRRIEIILQPRLDELYKLINEK